MLRAVSTRVSFPKPRSVRALIRTCSLGDRWTTDEKKLPSTSFERSPARGNPADRDGPVDFESRRGDIVCGSETRVTRADTRPATDESEARATLIWTYTLI
jgi:hypothetical protein